VRENISTSNDVGTLDSQRDDHQVPWMVTHRIWCPTRRRKVVVHQVGRRCEDLLRQQGDEQGWMLLDLALQPDRVQRLVRVWPSVSAAEVVNVCVVNACKGFAACTLRNGFPAVPRLPSRWTRSSLAALPRGTSAGQPSDAPVKRELFRRTAIGRGRAIRG
jgi:REP element-mobilizing transposase RayT